MSNLDLTTTFVNTGDKRRFFSYITSNGRELEAGEEFTVLGDIFTAASACGTRTAKRYLEALQKDLEDGKVEIKSSPGIIFYDGKLDNSKVIKVENGENRIRSVSEST